MTEQAETTGEKKEIADISGNLFFTSKRGFKSHVQIKTVVLAGEPIDIVNLLLQLEENVVDSGGKPEEAFKPKPVKSQDDAFKETFGAEKDSPPTDGECPNGCGKRPWIEAGISKKTNKPYKAFWGECRTCGYKEKKKW